MTSPVPALFQDSHSLAEMLAGPSEGAHSCRCLARNPDDYCITDHAVQPLNPRALRTLNTPDQQIRRRSGISVSRLTKAADERTSTLVYPSKIQNSCSLQERYFLPGL